MESNEKGKNTDCKPNPKIFTLEGQFENIDLTNYQLFAFLKSNKLIDMDTH